MKINPNDRDEKNKSQDMSGVTGLLSQYMQSQFQSTLSQFKDATVSTDSPLNVLMKTGFLNRADSISAAQNPANLNTQPLAALDLSAMHMEPHELPQGLVVPTDQPTPEAVSLSALQSQGVIAKTPGEEKFQDIVQQASQKYDVPVALINAVIKQESAFNPQAQSGAGAQGLMQLMPATAKAYGCTNSFDPAQNVMAGTHFLSDLLKMYKGDVPLALAGYNAGPGNVAKYGNQIPPFKETQNYVAKVQNNFQVNVAALDRSTAKFA